MKVGCDLYLFVIISGASLLLEGDNHYFYLLCTIFYFSRNTPLNSGKINVVRWYQYFSYSLLNVITNYQRTIWDKKIGSQMFGWNWVRYCWYRQISPEQMLQGQMSSWRTAYSKDGPRNIPLRFGQNLAELFLIWTNATRTNVGWSKLRQ